MKETLSKQIYDILKEDIIQQKIPCGTKITLKSLQTRFGLSSTPIREAIKVLSSEGLIIDVTNVGARVISFNRDDVTEIYNFCCVLDTAALRFALNRKPCDNFCSEILECMEKQKQALDQMDLEDFKIYSDKFHDLFFIYAHNSRLYDASKKIRSQLSILTTKYQSVSVAKSVVLVEHAKIAEAIAAQDAEKAADLLQRHFYSEKEYLLKNFNYSQLADPEGNRRFSGPAQLP